VVAHVGPGNNIQRRAVLPRRAKPARGSLDAALLPPTKLSASGAVQQRLRFGSCDSRVVAAAQAAACARPLSEDLQHGRQIETRRVHNPFAGGPCGGNARH
jgi:hypothetical protein